MIIPGKKMLILDLDNCISDDRHRIPLIDWSKTDPEERHAAYHAKCHEDQCRPMQLSFGSMNRFVIAIFTARPESVREQTVKWLADNGVKWTWLFMRPDGDSTSSVPLKKGFLESLFTTGIVASDIAYAIDDRLDIVEMYRSMHVNGYQSKIHDVCAFNPPSEKLSGKNPSMVVMDDVAPSMKIGELHVEITGEEAAKELAKLVSLPSFTSNEAFIKDATIGFGGIPSSLSDKVRKDAADLLVEMGDTYRQRNAIYGSNYEMVGPIMAILFPDGVPVELLRNNSFHLFELVIVKLSRLAISKLTHQDSSHDAAVYCAMIEAIILQQQEGK